MNTLKSLNNCNEIVCFTVVLCLIFSSCRPDPLVVEGLAPIYISELDFSVIRSSEPRPIYNPGLIVQQDGFLFINEINKGIHVFDNIDPHNPIPIYFWEIPGNLDFSFNKNLLYADNSIHLLVIDINDFDNVKVINHIKDLYINNPVPSPKPENFSGFFECISKSNGIQIGWKITMLSDPLCKTI